MKNKFFVYLLIFISFFYQSTPFVYCEDSKTEKSFLDNQNFTEKQKKKYITMKGFFILYFNSIWEWIPKSYKYIDLKFQDIEPNTQIYSALQKWVYLDLIENKNLDLKLDKLLPKYFLNKIIKDNFNEELVDASNTSVSLWEFIALMKELKSVSKDKVSQEIEWLYEVQKIKNFYILDDVYKKLKTSYYNSDKLKDEELIQWAIKWMTDSAGDKYTTYFPPVEAKNFMDELSWEFEWIWAHIDMDKPWILTIISPLSDSPAEKAWLKPWDQITKIDDFEVTEKVTLQEAVNRVKWPTWTKVKLTILRAWKELVIEVIRAKIKVNFVEYKRLENQDNYIKISIFGDGVVDGFSWAVNEVIKNSNYKTIIDLRNNPWWNLDAVSRMLEFFAPKWEPVVNIKLKDSSYDIPAFWFYNNYFIDKKVIVLINNWSASASEIMAWTIKDYLGDNVKIIWEKSYGKWSVQSLLEYDDKSSFKYTIAKWFTGKTKTGIDWIWIKPDIEVKFDEENYKNSKMDNQLEYAKNYRF